MQLPGDDDNSIAYEFVFEVDGGGKDDDDGDTSLLECAGSAGPCELVVVGTFIHFHCCPVSSSVTHGMSCTLREVGVEGVAVAALAAVTPSQSSISSCVIARLKRSLLSGIVCAQLSVRGDVCSGGAVQQLGLSSSAAVHVQ
jgi:hypothetical protein